MHAIVYTTAPANYDYEWTVLESAEVRVLAPWRAEPLTFRKLTLDAREDGYYSTYQQDRYRSGGYPVLSERQWLADVASGHMTPTDAR
jgi:hypothetical protein